MTDRHYKTPLENPTQDEIEAAGQEYYGDNSSKPAKVVKAGKYIMLLRKKAVFQKHQIAERDTEITRLNERVAELEDALRRVVEIGHTASDSYFEKAKNITAGAYPAALNTKDGRMANDMTKTRRKIREVAARLGVSELDVWYCSVDYQRAIKREQEAERLGMEKGA